MYIWQSRCESLWMTLLCLERCYVNIIGLIDTFQKVKSGRGQKTKHNSHRSLRRKCTGVSAGENIFWLQIGCDRQVFVSTEDWRGFVTELSASQKNLIQIPPSLFVHTELLCLIPACVALISGIANLQEGINKKSKAGWLTLDNLTTAWCCSVRICSDTPSEENT